MARNMIDEEIVFNLILSCNICLKKYKKPKILSCFHTFCEECLSINVPHHSLALTCPSCDGHSILPQDGVTELKDNEFINSFMEILKGNTAQAANEASSVSFMLNTNDMELHANTNQAQASATNDLEDFNKVHQIFDAISCTSLTTCQRHADQIVSSYCRSCDTLICHVCIQAEHWEHRDLTTSLQRIAEDCKIDLLKQTNNINERIDVLRSWLSNMEETSNELSINRDVAELEANETFLSLEEELHRRRDGALREIDVRYAAKRDVLDRQISELRSAVKNMETGSAFVEESLREESNLDCSGTEKATARNDGDTSDVALGLKPETKTEKEINEKIKTYFLHKHMTSRLENLYEHGDSPSPYSNDDVTNAKKTLNNQPKNPKKNDYFSTSFSSPNENDFFQWRKSQNFKNFFDSFKSTEIGRVVTDHAVAEKSIISGECLQDGATCAVGRESHVILTAKDFNGDIEISEIIDIIAELEYCDVDSRHNVTYTVLDESDTNNQIESECENVYSGKQMRDVTSKDISSCKVTPTSSEGSYELSFITSKPGMYKLNVKMHNKHVTNSPCHIHADVIKPKKRSSTGKSPKIGVAMRTKGVRQKATKRPQSAGPSKNPIEDDLVITVGSRGRNKGEFANPQDVAADASGRLYVTDSNNQCIQVFKIKTGKETTAKFMARFGDKGRGSGQIYRPTGISVLPSGDVAVSDYENKIVNLFSSEGNYKSRIGSGKLMGPRGICVNQDGHLVVVDNKQCQIFIFQINGKLVTKFGARGSGKTQLAGPHYAAVNQNNEILITDFYNHCVKVFSSSGNYLRSFGSNGEGCGQFNAPTGITIDNSGHVIVADWGNSRLQVFDDKGSFVTYVNSIGEPLYGPQGVSVTNGGFLAAADSGNQCVKIYRVLQ